jgi:hypothetical protein
MLKSDKEGFIALFFIPFTIFVVSVSFFPMTIDSDNGLLIKSAQQYHLGQVDRLHTFRGVSPDDLSKDVDVWINWYTPGVSILFYPVFKLGLSLGDGVRLFSLVFFNIGLFGWYKVWKYLNCSTATLWMLVFTSAIYYIRIGGCLYLHGDILPFSVFPWLLIFGLFLISLIEAANSYNRKLKAAMLSLIFGICCGSVYWLKYSGFIPVAGLLTGVCLYILFRLSRLKLGFRLFYCIFVGSSFLPVLILNILNSKFSGVTDLTEQAVNAGFNENGVSLVETIFSVLAGPGLNLFNFYGVAQHFFFFMDDTFPFLKIFGTGMEKLPWFSLLGIPGVISTYYLLSKSHLYFNKKITEISWVIWIVTFCLMGYSSWLIGCNFINIGMRYTAVFIFLFHILIFEVFWRESEKCKKNKYKIRVGWISFFILIPGFFEITRTLKGTVFNEKMTQYISSKKELKFDYLSENDLNSFTKQVNSLKKSKSDILAVAHTLEVTNFGAWLEFENFRILPLCSVDLALKHVYGNTANCFNKSKFFTTENMRIILVLSKEFLAEDGNPLSTIKSRFPQSGKWHKLPSMNSDSAEVWYKDIIPKLVQ